MPLKGSRLIGEKRFFRSSPLNYHAADRAGRMYWCGCARCIRSAGKPKPLFMLKGRDGDTLLRNRWKRWGMPRRRTRLSLTALRTPVNTK